MEKWDLFDDKRQPLFRTHNRQDKIINGEYHVVVGVWTVNTDNEVLLTLRHPMKKEYPNLWENTCGSVLAEELSKDGVMRELFEETGIIVNENELSFLGTRKEEAAFIDTYIVRKDIKISELTLQDGETVDAQWVNLNKLDEMMKLGTIALPIAERLVPLRKKFEDFLFNIKN